MFTYFNIFNYFYKSYYYLIIFCQRLKLFNRLMLPRFKKMSFSRFFRFKYCLIVFITISINNANAETHI